MNSFVITAIQSYLLGSIPFGYILVRLFRGQDVRQSGSGNIGATNVSRTSPVLGVATLILDAAKGLAAVWLAESLFLYSHATQQIGSPADALHARQVISILAAEAALFAVLGHVFPVWLRFSGGKGVATALGSFVLLAPKTILVLIIVFAIMALVFRYVSLASVTAVIFFPMLAAFLDGWRNAPRVLGLMISASVIVIWKHSDNLQRIFAGTENRLAVRKP